MHKALLISTIIANATPLINVGFAEPITNSKEFSSVKTDLKNLKIEQNFTSTSFITLTVGKNDANIYFYTDDLISANTIDVKMATTAEKDEDGFYVKDTYFRYVFTIVSKENNYYKAVSTNNDILSTEKIELDKITYRTATSKKDIEVQKTFFPKENRVIYEDTIKVTSGTAKCVVIDERDWYWGILIPKNEILNYYFFNLSFDDSFGINDRITDVTISYDYFDWSAKLGWLVYDLNKGFNYVANTYEHFKKSNWYSSYKESIKKSQTVRIDESSGFSRVKHHMIGKTTYKFNGLFDTATESENNKYVKKYKDSYKWGCLFFHSQNKITSPFNGDPDATSNIFGVISNLYQKRYGDRTVSGTAVENVILLQISFYKDGVYYQNVSVVDEKHKVNYDGKYKYPDTSSESEKDGDWLDDLIKAIINFFKSIPAFFIKYKWLLYVVIGVIVFLLIAPILTTLINLIKSIGG